MERQGVLAHDDRPGFWVIMNEAALRSRVGSDAVMRDQLLHLVTVSKTPGTSIQVIPLARGAHPAMASGPFVVLGFPDPEDPEIVRLETLTGGAYVEDESAVARYTLIHDHLRAAALPPKESRALIGSVAREYAANREDA
jgi:hypothetical protein